MKDEEATVPVTRNGDSPTEKAEERRTEMMNGMATKMVQLANGTVVTDHRHQAGHRDPRAVARTTESSKKMIPQEIAHQDFGSVEDLFASLANGGRELSLLLVAQEKARAALARARDDAAIEAQDVLSQAEEALVMG